MWSRPVNIICTIQHHRVNREVAYITSNCPAPLQGKNTASSINSPFPGSQGRTLSRGLPGDMVTGETEPRTQMNDLKAVKASLRSFVQEKFSGKV